MKRKRPTKAEQGSFLVEWHKHTAAVEAGFKNAAAAPPWWHRLGASLYDFWTAPVQPVAATPLPTVSGPPLRQYPACPHPDAVTMSLGALIRKPKKKDLPLYAIDALACPNCGMLVAVIR